MTVSQPDLTHGPEPGGPDPTDRDRLIPLKVKTVLLVVLIAVVGLICYGIGTNHGTGSHVATGRAYVSPYQVGVRTGGWSYGFEITQNGMFWYDAHGGFHEGGIPPCLRHGPRFSWIRFGWSTANGLGNHWRMVTWVQCINHR
ncbi:MAG TPA: hypothetical protein VGH43_06195 [Jatrophihabitans sp.]|jgi:hypothetical protein